jgi:hypothetical protein
MRGSGTTSLYTQVITGNTSEVRDNVGGHFKSFGHKINIKMEDEHGRGDDLQRMIHKNMRTAN